MVMGDMNAESLRFELMYRLEVEWPGVDFWVSYPYAEKITWTDGPTKPMVAAFLGTTDPFLDPRLVRKFSARMLESVKLAFIRKYGAARGIRVAVAGNEVITATLSDQRDFYEIADRRVIIRNGKIA